MRVFTRDPAAIRRLTPEQYRVTQMGGAEPPGSGEYLHHRSRGIYVDIVSGEPLFASSDKFDAGSGWPSFSRPLEPSHVREVEEIAHGITRTEVRSVHGESHLGHVFHDGPLVRGGRRYCINSAALRFVPRERMEAEGYADYLDRAGSSG